jgi:hypothetical protein
MARYGKAAAKAVRRAMRRRKHGTLRSGRGGKGGVVRSRKQAIAIGLSEAREKGAKVPRKKYSSARRRDSSLLVVRSPDKEKLLPRSCQRRERS